MIAATERRALYTGRMMPHRFNWGHFRRLQIDFAQASDEFEATADVDLRRIALDKMHEVVAEMDAITEQEHQRLERSTKDRPNRKP